MNRTAVHRVLVALAAWVASASVLALELRGDLHQGSVLRGSVAPGSQVRLDGQPVPVSASGQFVVGFDRDAPADALLEWREPRSDWQQQTLAVQTREYRIERVNGVPQRTVTVPEAEQRRIAEEAALVRQARQPESGLEDFTTDFQWPLQGRISGVFGSQRVYNGEPRRPHYGVDIAAPAGTAVRAPAGGVVVLAHADMFYSGGTLILDHGHGLTSSFLHLKRILVAQGQRVAQGDVIAEVGSTGRSTGPHLDWRMNWRDRRMDPVSLVGPMPARDEPSSTERN